MFLCFFTQNFNFKKTKYNFMKFKIFLEFKYFTNLNPNIKNNISKLNL